MTQKKKMPLDPEHYLHRFCKNPECRHPFMANNGNRFYCKEKYGIKDYCKHRTKKLREEHPELFAEEGSLVMMNSSEQGEGSVRVEMALGFQAMLNGQEEVNVTTQMLKNYNIDIRKYDRLVSHPRDPDLSIAEYGDYALAWVEPDLFLLTHINKLLWITQI